MPDHKDKPTKACTEETSRREAEEKEKKEREKREAREDAKDAMEDEEAGSSSPSSRVRVWFAEARHAEPIGGARKAGDESWKNKDRLKTLSVALVVCLNIGVDPPDVVKPNPCARDECWKDTMSMSPVKALESVGKALQDQYYRWQPRARYKQCLDPTVEDVKKLCLSLRRNAKDERVLFHYNGHGVPKPTDNGEIWLFNKNFTQYIPLSLYDLQQWLGSPSVMVYDANCAGLILESVRKFAAEPLGLPDEHINAPPRRPGANEVIQLAACGVYEMLPTSPELPADLFTSCLTTPIKTAVLCYVLQNKLSDAFPERIWEHLPGSLADRRTLLGELNWIFTAITDTIAWNTLSRHLFQKLFRQDLLVASLFRNFLLAERVMRSYNCTPVSDPALPSAVEHPLWEAWDYALDTVLTPLKASNLPPPAPVYTHSDFFASQLKAFEVWLQFGYKHRQPPQQLPVVLQVLLSQVHRVKALELLGRFLDLGPWAVSLALSVGIFPYVLKLLLSKDRDLKPLLSFIWAKILAVDPACHRDLVKEEGQIFFVDILRDKEGPVQEKIVPAFILSALMDNFAGAQEKLRNYKYLDVTVELLREWTPGTKAGGMVHMWLLIGLGRLWTDYSEARWLFLRNFEQDTVINLLEHPVPEVRAAAAFALGTLVANQSADSVTAAQMDASISHALVLAISKESSILVRKELLVALAAFVADFEATFVTQATKLMKQRQSLESRITPPQAERQTSHPGEVTSPSSRIFSLARVASFDGRLKASPSPPPTTEEPGSPAALLADMRHLLTGRVSRNIYESVWLTLLRLLGDPSPDVAGMASSVLRHILDLAGPIFLQQEALGREMAAGAKGRLKSAQSLTQTPRRSPPTELSALEINGEETRATFLVGSPASTPSLVDSSGNVTGSTASTAPTPSTPVAVSPRGVSPREAATRKEPLLQTEFVAWCSKRFTQPLLPTVRSADGDAWSLSPMENYHSRTRWCDLSDWSATTVDTLKTICRSEAEAVHQRRRRIEAETWVQRLEEEPTALDLTPLAAHVFLAYPSGTVEVWDHESAGRTARFRNGKSSSDRACWVHVINPFTHSFCLTATAAGVARIWDLGLQTTAQFELPPDSVRLSDSETSWQLLEEEEDREPRLIGSTSQPRLISAWNLLGALDTPATKSTFTWEESSGTLLAAGSFGFIRLWDAVAERTVEDVKLSPGVRVRSLSSDTGGHRLIVAGCSDASVRLFDRRLASSSANVTTLRGFETPISKVTLQPMELDPKARVVASCSGNEKPAVRIWEPRMYQDPVTTIEVEGEGGVREMAVHPRGELIALSTGGAQPAISVHNFRGRRLSCIRYHEGMMGQRIGASTQLAFHPFRLALAAASADNLVALYGLNS